MRPSDLLVVFAVALALRLLACALIYPTPLVAEEAIHANRALVGESAISFGPENRRAPGVIVFFDAVAAVFGPGVVHLRVANAVAASLFIALFLAWSARFVSRRVAVLASLLLAVHPELVFHSVSLWNEPLYLLLLGACLLLYGHARRTRSPWTSLATGALLGALSLTREVGLVLAVLLALILALEPAKPRARSVLCAALLSVACGAVVLPWSISMTRRAGHPVVITALNLNRLYVGNVPLPGSPDPRPDERIKFLGGKYHELADGTARRRSLAWHEAWAAIRADMPWWPLRKTYVGVRSMLGLNSFPAARLLAQPSDPGWFGKWALRFSGTAIDRRLAGDILGWMTVAFHTLFVIAGAAGLALRRWRSVAVVLVALAVAHLAPPIVTLACSRYRVPLMPLFALGAAALLVEGRSAWDKASRGRRVVAVVGTATVLAILVSSASRLLPPQYG